MKTATRLSSIKYLSRLPVQLRLLPFIFWAAPLLAQQSFHIEPVFRNYTTENGLPSNETFAILQDREGYMWFSTNLGVCRFDGYRFDQFPDTLQANFTAVLTPCLKEDECGRIWWADLRGRLFYIENDRIQPWAYNHIMDSLRTAGAYRNIIGLLVEGCGDDILLAAHYLGTLHFDRNGNFKPEPEPDPEIFGGVLALTDRTSGFFNNYVSSGNPALPFQYNPYWLFKEGNYSEPLPDVNHNLIKYSFAGKLNEGRYLVMLGQNMYLFQDLKLQWWRKYDREIVWAFEDDDGSLLVGQQRGGGVRRYTSLADLRAGKIAASFLKGLSISIIYKDREGGYWFGSQEQGLFYCASLNAGVVQGLPDLAGDIGKGVVAGEGEKLYYGTQNGRVFALDLAKNTWRDISPGMDYLSTLYFAPRSNMLLVTGPFTPVFRAGNWLKRTDSANSIRLAPFDPNKNQWLVVYPTWIQLENMRFPGKKRDEERMYGFRGKFYDNRKLYSIAMDGAGRTWTSSSVGFQSFSDGRFHSPEIQHPVFQQPSKDIQLLNDSTLVFCPRSYGLAFWNPDSKAAPEIIGETQGLVFNKVDRLFLERDGAVWACTEHGASRIAADRSRIDNYTVKNGLPANQVSQVAEAGGWYWLATGKGLARIEPEPRVTPMPAPKLVSLAANGVPYSTKQSLDLPHDSASIAIRWVALHFRSNGHIRYRYRLISDEQTPNWNSTEQLEVNYSNLSPGIYRFEVQAQGVKGEWSETTASALLIRPPWYATWWARGTALVLLVLLSWSLYRYRVAAIRTESRLKEEMLQLERSALQAQMNPHFIFNCLNSIQHFILNNDPDAAVLYLAKFAKLVRGTLHASVTGVISLEDEVRMLDNYLALEQLRFNQLFEYQITVEEALDQQKIQLPPLIVQPFVENAVLHGMKDREHGGRITVTFGKAAGFLCVRISDNGAGFSAGSTAREKQSLGRSITQRRIDLLQQLNAKQEVFVEYLVGENGLGTTVVIQLPLGVARI